MNNKKYSYSRTLFGYNDLTLHKCKRSVKIYVCSNCIKSIFKKLTFAQQWALKSVECNIMFCCILANPDDALTLFYHYFCRQILITFNINYIAFGRRL